MHFAAAAAADATNELPNVAAPPLSSLLSLSLAAAADLALHSSIAEEREGERRYSAIFLPTTCHKGGW